jgi:hypothetical protein
MSLFDLMHNSWARGVTIRRFPGGERPMVHRWRKDQMKGVTKDVLSLVADNVTRSNPLYEQLKRKRP